MPGAPKCFVHVNSTLTATLCGRHLYYYLYLMKKLSHRSEMIFLSPDQEVESWDGTQAAWLPHHNAYHTALELVRQTQIQSLLHDLTASPSLSFLFYAKGLTAEPP